MLTIETYATPVAGICPSTIEMYPNVCASTRAPRSSWISGRFGKFRYNFYPAGYPHLGGQTCVGVVIKSSKRGATPKERKYRSQSLLPEDCAECSYAFRRSLSAWAPRAANQGARAHPLPRTIDTTPWGVPASYAQRRWRRHPRKDQPILDYLDALREEIRIVADRAPKGLQVREVHFGGGTPTIIEPAEFASLMELLRQRFEFTAAASIAIEIDPRTLTADMAEALGAAGVGRASLGVQSFDPVVQKAVNRIQSEGQAAEAVDNLRHHGVARINFDLIYGLPHQTAQSCVDTATAAVAMKPDRLAVFGYARPDVQEASADDRRSRLVRQRSEQASAIAETLVAAGYRQIGLDHFALPDNAF